MLAEEKRLSEAHDRVANWQRWGPYLSERQWGTVREDYSPDGECWKSFPHDHARSRAYRWGEDGLLGITDRECRLCFGLALWNGRDPILKERLFGLTGPEGNHGEDVKECYYFLDSTPTHSYLKALYKYPQAEYPYKTLIRENKKRGRNEPEFELADTGVFDEGRYFDVLIEYAKNAPDDICIRITVANRGPDTATLCLLPTLWFRNTWTWGCKHEGCWRKPRIARSGEGACTADHVTLGKFVFRAAPGPGGVRPMLLFTENETNQKRLYNVPNRTPYVRDAFHNYVIHGMRDAVNPEMTGTKAAVYYRLELQPGAETTVSLRLFPEDTAPSEAFGAPFDAVFAQRIRDADEFYAARAPEGATDTEQQVIRQAYAGLLWNKQFYHYIVTDWLEGDPAMPPPPPRRKQGRNADWPHLFNRDIVSMPDTWEYPWYAAWDLAFHMIAFATVDPEFAKSQLLLFLREWYMHPSGALPAYEFKLDDANPPVHAWACWRVYKMTGPKGARDTRFLSRVFLKLMLNFTWWVNRKDPGGNNIFSGGFLGLDNIGVFDRSAPLPPGEILEQADGTAWMAFYSLTMLAMALELARDHPEYEDVASKFFEHFVAITDAMNALGGDGLWDEQDGFYYDQLQLTDRTMPLRVRSMVGVIPLFAVEVLEKDVIEGLSGFKKRLNWFLDNRSDLTQHISYLERCAPREGAHARRLLAIPSRDRLERMLRYVLDEREFLSPYGVRSLSRVHRDSPFLFRLDSTVSRVDYEPGESTSGLFGGNSNWRGPVWFPMNYLLIEALERYHHFYGDTLRMEFPTGSGKLLNLGEIANELAMRISSLFLPDANGRRPCYGAETRYTNDPHWRDLLLFHEYFHGDDGAGLGASHQTGWTALVIRTLEQAIRARNNRQAAP